MPTADVLSVAPAPRGDPRTTGTLVRAAQEGDRAAFGILYERHVRLAHAVLLGCVEPDDAADLVHDVFLIALRELPRLRDPEAFGGWLTMIARNQAKMHLRSRRPSVALDERVQAPSQPMDARLDAAHVLGHVRMLPEKLREPLLLRLVEGLSGDEIAAATGLSHGTVRVYLHEAMRALRMRLRAEE